MTYVTRNKLTGVVDNHTQDHIFEHPVLGKDLELVEEGTKPLVPELIKYEPATPDLFPDARVEEPYEGEDEKSKTPAKPEKKD